MCLRTVGLLWWVGAEPTAACVLDGEVVAAAAGRWEALGSDIASHAVVVVAGGLVAIGEDLQAAAPELFDEQSGRWIALAHGPAASRDGGEVVVLASALAPAAPAGAAAAPPF